MRKRLQGVFGIILICWGCLFSISPAAAMDVKSFDAAAGLLRKGQYTDALNQYQTAADHADTPNAAAQALLLKAVAINGYLHQPDAALTLLKQIQTRYPESPAASDALFHAGMILCAKEQYPAARDAFSLYINQCPGGFRVASARSWKAHAERQTGRHQTVTGPALSDVAADSKIRVLMSENSRQVDIGAANHRLWVQDVFSGTLLYQGAGPVRLTHRQGRLVLNGQPLALRQCRVETDGTYLSLDDTRSRGVLMVHLEPDGIQVINQIPLEQYLYGIISREMPSGWPRDALKAQAVASRTYALYISTKNKLMPYDVEATTASQVYGGYDAETAATNAAVDATRGQVLAHDNQLVIAYFHSNSAGHTEDAFNVWHVKIPYLKGVPDRFSNDIPNSSWEYYLSYATASRRLNDAGLNVGRISAIRCCEYSPSGRVQKLAVQSNNGSTFLSANHFRCMLDAKRIKSTYFKIISAHSGVILRGVGYGHGVGMSQWGANQMAVAGYSHREILKHYYPGVALATLGNI